MEARTAPAQSAVPSPESEPASAAARIEPTQRWRLTAGRSATAPELSQRETTAEWEATLLRSGLPIVPVGEGTPVRPRLQVGAALPLGMAADGELLDVLLAERLPRWRVRESLGTVVPTGWRLVDLEDVWLGGPALSGLVAAADYRVTLDGDTEPSTIEAACRRLLAAATLPREREKGGGTVTYDLRPLLLDLAVAEPGPPAVLAIRTRIHPSLGSGRPDEVVAALGDALGQAVVATSTVRERLRLADELD